MNGKVKQMMIRQNSSLDWSSSHQGEFVVSKFGMMGLTRRHEKNPSVRPPTRPIQRHPILIQGVEVPAVNTHKFLSVLLNQELCWKYHVNHSQQKGMQWVTQYCRLTRPSKGVSDKYMRCFYISVMVPKLLYAADLFLVPESCKGRGTKGLINRLSKIERQASLHITSALKSTPTDTLDACSDLLPFHLLVEKQIPGGF